MEKKSSKKKEEVDKTKQYKAPSKKKQASGKNTKASGKKPTKEEVKNMSKEQRKAYKKMKRKKSKLRKFFLVLFLLIVLAIMVGLGIFAGLFFGDTWSIDERYLTINTANSIVYDKEDNVICELNGDENRKIISMNDEEMSPYLPKAFIAIEDKRFYEHHGVDIKRTAAATINFIIHR